MTLLCLWTVEKQAAHRSQNIPVGRAGIHCQLITVLCFVRLVPLFFPASSRSLKRIYFGFIWTSSTIYIRIAEGHLNFCHIYRLVLIAKPVFASLLVYTVRNMLEIARCYSPEENFDFGFFLETQPVVNWNPTSFDPPVMKIIIPVKRIEWILWIYQYEHCHKYLVSL
jgi:hypothetical protein